VDKMNQGGSFSKKKKKKKGFQGGVRTLFKYLGRHLDFGVLTNYVMNKKY
jgi:hypothetical protein